MNLQEFKGWFEGFTEAITGKPTAAQWKRIQARVKEIDGIATPYPVFVDRYVYPYRPFWGSHYYQTALGGCSTIRGTNNVSTGDKVIVDALPQNMSFTMAGRAEAASLQ